MTHRMAVTDPSSVGEARRDVRRLATSAGLAEPDVERATLVASEIASNLAKHAVEGELLVRVMDGDGRHGVEMLGVDRGPGIKDVGASLRDGFSTAGSQGTGLGAIRRLASVFDLWSQPTTGTVLLAQVWDVTPSGGAGAMVVGSVSTAIAGETVCGDGWIVFDRARGCTAVVVDGVGHGGGAAEATRRALDVLAGRRGRGPHELVDDVHHALRGTRGAAMSVAEVDLDRGVVRFSGIGNVAGMVVGATQTRTMVSHHGTLGHQVRSMHEFSYPWAAGDLLILASDGLQTRWSLERYPGVSVRHPSIVAALLHRDFRRDRDDATVVVVRERA
jgi:anti-sigma regulatory factor (Ser/Thr protein kinase)